MKKSGDDKNPKREPADTPATRLPVLEDWASEVGYEIKIEDLKRDGFIQPVTSPFKPESL